MKKILAVLGVLVVATMLCSCDKFMDKGPTNEQTQQIFENFFKKSIPIDWAGSMMGGKLKNITLTNVKRGESMKKSNNGQLPPDYSSTCQDCWPVSMRVKGVAMANMIFNWKEHSFEEETSFKLCKTYENGWMIFTDGRMMTGGM